MVFGLFAGMGSFLVSRLDRSSARHHVCSHAMAVKSTEPVEQTKKRNSVLSRDVYLLRFDLIGTKIDFQKAREILFMAPGFDQELQRLCETADGNIYHLYDHKNDQSYETCEWIIILHPVRNWLALFGITPFNQNNNSQYAQFMPMNRFWEKTELLYLLETAYAKLHAARRIKRNRHFRNWLQKPITKDGKMGIECRTAWLAANDSRMSGRVIPIDRYDDIDAWRTGENSPVHNGKPILQTNDGRRRSRCVHEKFPSNDPRPQSRSGEGNEDRSASVRRLVEDDDRGCHSMQGQ